MEPMKVLKEIHTSNCVFYSNSVKLLEKYKFSQTRISNTDEMGQKEHASKLVTKKEKPLQFCVPLA